MAAQTPAGGSTWLVYPGGIGGGNLDAGIKHVTSGWEADALEAAGWRAFPTEAAARAFETESAGQNVSSAVSGVAKDITSASPIAGLFQGSLWLRVAEVAAGLILIGIGLNAMLKGRPLTIVTSAAGKAGKAAMLA